MKISAKWNRNYTAVSGKMLNHWWSNWFLKDKHWGCHDQRRRQFQYFTTCLENASLLRRRRLRSCNIVQVSLLNAIRVWWKKKSKGLWSILPLKLLKTRTRSARVCLRSSEKRLSLRSLSSYGAWRRPLTSFWKDCPREKQNEIRKLWKKHRKVAWGTNGLRNRCSNRHDQGEYH